VTAALTTIDRFRSFMAEAGYLGSFSLGRVIPVSDPFLKKD